MATKSLDKAKLAKNDEFYTKREDIENELKYYSKHFYNKRFWSGLFLGLWAFLGCLIFKQEEREHFAMGIVIGLIITFVIWVLLMLWWLNEVNQLIKAGRNE